MSTKLSKRVSSPVLLVNSSTKIFKVGRLVIFLIISSFTKESGPHGKELKKRIPSTEY